MYVLTVVKQQYLFRFNKKYFERQEYWFIFNDGMGWREYALLVLPR